MAKGRGTPFRQRFPRQRPTRIHPLPSVEMERPKLLYLSFVEFSPSHAEKLAGIRRYCSMRGWEAVPILRNDVPPASLPAILSKFRPVGCVVEGIGRYVELPPRLFGKVPVSYIGYPRRKTGDKPNFMFDYDAIADAALRELSAGKPACYAVVGSSIPLKWSLNRVRAFCAAVAATGAKCRAFPPLPQLEPEADDRFVERLVPWLARLPQHCAVYVVSDETAVMVARAAQIAGRSIPRSLTLLSVDNFANICEKAEPPISSIMLDFERQGFVAAKAAVEGLRMPPGISSARPPVTAIKPLLVVRRKSTGGSGRHEPWILNAVETIRREACDGLSAAELIARHNVSKRLFTLRFREATGHSVLDEIIHVRLEKALTLLSQTDTAVGAIPGLCGFNCDRTLDAIFRKRFGVSMSAWRRQNSR